MGAISRFGALSLIVIAACRSSESGGGGARTVTINAFGGEQPEPGVLVISSAPDGTILDQTNADAVGRAALDVDDDSVVSVLFPGNITSLTSAISIVTVAAPADELSIHGPARTTPPLIVGVLQVSGPNLTAAKYFDVTIGCATTRVTSLPASIDVGACSMGSDTNLDVLVAGYHDVGTPPVAQLDGYAAGRVPMTNELAMFNAPSWTKTGTNVPVTADGVTAVVEMELLSDGLPFGPQTLTDHATLWTGLTVDATRITASLPGLDAARVTTRELAGTPTAIAFAASDFLAPISVSATIANLAPANITWDAAGIGDAVNLHAVWELGGSVQAVVPTGPHRVIWNAVLPPDATGVTLPALDGDLARAIMPIMIDPIDVAVRYVDSDAHDGFAALLAAGVHAEQGVQASTIAPRPVDGELRVSLAIGTR